jgi:DNA-binding PadR family transcriptional regulator
MEDAMNMRPRGRHSGRGGPHGPRHNDGLGHNEGFGGEFAGPRGPRGPRARRGQVRLAILTLLAEAPRNGYQIIQALEERTRGAWRPSPGAVYPALAQLEDEGLIRADEQEGQRAYRLTPAGETAAAAVDPMPWDAAGPDAARDPRTLGAPSAGSLRHELDALAMAVRAVALDADPDRILRATSVLSGARRSLHSLLAEPEPGPEA